MALRGRCALVALITLTLLGAVRAGAQVPSIKGPGKKALQVIQLVQQDLPGQSDVDLYTVPEGNTFVVTDFLVSNGAAQANLVAISRSESGVLTSLTHPILLPAQDTRSFHFASGLEFGPGTHVSVGTGAPNQAISVTLSGYLRKP